MDTKAKLEALYRRLNKKEYIHPDPLEFLYGYPETRDREVSGLIASSMAYGRVAQILKSVAFVLEEMGPSPYVYLHKSTYRSLARTFTGFRYRFANGKHLAALLFHISRTLKTHGSLNQCFLYGMKKNNNDFFSGLTYFSKALSAGRHSPGHLIPDPTKKSACKRMNLFLRWMVRTDDVDPGGWQGVKASDLIIPLDTHMHKVGLGLGFTERKAANMKTAIEITEGFRRISVEDPVKYDFSLTRLGIRNDMQMEKFIFE